MRKAAGSSSDDIREQTKKIKALFGESLKKGAWDSGCTEYHSINYIITSTT